MTPEFEQLAQFVDREIATLRCRAGCHICSGRHRGYNGLPPWSQVMAGPVLGFGQFHPRRRTP